MGRISPMAGSGSRGGSRCSDGAGFFPPVPWIAGGALASGGGRGARGSSASTRLTAGGSMPGAPGAGDTATPATAAASS